MFNKEGETVKVKELIEKLQEMDPDAVVVFFEEMDSSGGWKVVENIHGSVERDGSCYACLE